MSMKTSMNNLGITAKVLVIAVLPVVIVSSILAYYVTNERIDDAYKTLKERGQTLVTHVATMSEFGLFTGNTALLQSYTDAAILEPDVLSATIYDNNKQPVANSTKSLVRIKSSDVATETPLLATDNTLTFSITVIPSGFNLEDFNDEFSQGEEALSNQSNNTLGVVTVSLSKTSTQEFQKEIIRNSIFITIIGILVSLAIALRIGKNITDPVLNLTRMEKMLRQGKFNTRIPISSTKELGTLEQGFNSLAETLEQADEESKRQIKLATDTLEKTVATLEEKNQQLIIAQQKALEASQEKTDFLARMSHEIRTPMNAVLGFTNLLNNTPLNHDQAEYAHTITQSAKQLLSVIDDVLNFSKIASGSIKLEHIPLDVHSCFEDVINMLSSNAHDKGLELALLIHSDTPPCIKGDPTRIRQILINLIDNAIKFTEQGSVTVQVAKQQHENKLVTLEISVTDTGIGINQEEQKELFDAFSQADITISRRFGGTGLGLTIAKHFVEMMNGNISVESAPHKGSTFTFTIQCEQCQRPSLISQYHFNHLNILIYDLHLFSRRAIRNNLLITNANVFTAQDKTQLKSRLHAQEDNNRFDLIILGISTEELHDSNVNELIKTVRQHFSGPVLILFSTNELDFPINYQEDNNIFYMSKPLRSRTLYKKIDQLFFSKTEATHSIQLPSNTAKLEKNNAPKLKALIAEDNKFNRLLITSLLKKAHLDVTEAFNGQEAIDQANHTKFDIILMDIHLPIIDGGQATETIRKTSGHNTTTPIIALTADVFAKENDKINQAGFNDFIFKPILEEKLWNTLNKWLPTLSTIQQISPTHTVPPEFVNKLNDELSAQKDRLETAIKNNDIAALADAAHQLCGLAGYFAIEELENSARILEHTAKEQLEIKACLTPYQNLIDLMKELRPK